MLVAGLPQRITSEITPNPSDTYAGLNLAPMRYSRTLGGHEVEFNGTVQVGTRDSEL